MLSLYIHIPFCRQACSYCDFFFLVDKSREEHFFQALHLEWENRLENYLKNRLQSPVQISSVYFGGGTPSFVAPSRIAEFIKKLVSDERLKFLDDIEITLEANPEDLDAEQLAEYHKMGINRISLGVQSFRDVDLDYLGRVQTEKKVLSVIPLLTEAGWNWSLDLIYGVPTLSDEDWLTNLQTALKFEPPHLSLYGLTVEEKTPLAYKIKEKKRSPLSDDKLAKQFQIAMDVLEENGYQHYEISNFCKVHFSKHNLGYWSGREYIGLGPSAHSFYQKNEMSGRSYRRKNFSNLKTYLEAFHRDGKSTTSLLGMEWEEELTPANRFNEYVMTRLRTMWGISLSEIESLFGKEIQKEVLKNCQKYIDLEQMTNENSEVLKLTPKGKLFADRISAELFVAEE